MRDSAAVVEYIKDIGQFLKKSSTSYGARVGGEFLSVPKYRPPLRCCSTLFAVLSGAAAAPPSLGGGGGSYKYRLASTPPGVVVLLLKYLLDGSFDTSLDILSPPFLSRHIAQYTEPDKVRYFIPESAFLNCIVYITQKLYI